jgi:hypothetical protein
LFALPCFPPFPLPLFHTNCNLSIRRGHGSAAWRTDSPQRFIKSDDNETEKGQVPATAEAARVFPVHALLLTEKAQEMGYGDEELQFERRVLFIKP